MPPRKELCRNFQRGSCQYGDRCKFLHATQATQQQPKPNPFGFGMQSSSQFHRSNTQQQKSNPFGFGVQGSSQPRGSSDFGSKQNHFKPFENKWTRFSPVNNGGGLASRQSDNQPPPANHTCTDPESCKRQIIEDFEREKPLWKLTCYGHSRSSPCDIVGDVSFEELRAAAYDDAKRGLSLQSIVERERSLLNAKLLEFESLLRNPYRVIQNPAVGLQSSFPGASPGLLPTTAQGSTPAVSSFSQLGASLNLGLGIRPATPTYDYRPPNSVQVSNQTMSPFGRDNSTLGSTGSLGSQLHFQSGNSLASTVSFSNGVISAERSPFSAPTVSPMIQNGANSAATAVAQPSFNVETLDPVQQENGSVDDNIWLKEHWIAGEIPEEAPPDKFIKEVHPGISIV